VGTTVATPADVVVATSAADAAAVRAVEQHHAELAGRLGAHVDAMLAAAADQARFGPARAAAVAFCTGELAPHAAAEEQALYPAAARVERARLLVDGMVAEHVVIHQLVAELADTPDAVRAAAAGYALKVLFDAHLAKENDLVLPVVAADPSVSLAGILDGMHELLGADGHDGQHGEHEQPTHACGCGEADTAAPELDVRSVPHAIRHATVFGAPWMPIRVSSSAGLSSALPIQCGMPVSNSAASPGPSRRRRLPSSRVTCPFMTYSHS
jgi:hypothetical protein